METFTLILWIWMGPRFEETRMEGLARDECAEHWLRIFGDRQLVKGGCANATAYVVPPRTYGYPLCAHTGGSCSWPLLPGRRRV
jgi:hypothetical protein